ncbi:MAG: helix-turn-helix domain-containing protein [Pseudomonadales bacterium]|nr:helix-turn-helix domain-containing protein [Pseudomonadales bacterium]
MYNKFPPYVSVARRRAKAQRAMDKLRKKGQHIHPVEIKGRTIATTFWGSAWCTHLESFSDYANRLPRGRTYARNGSVCHLDVQQGFIKAIVSGSALYNIRISIGSLEETKWQHLQKQCAGEIGSMLELLQGKISSNVMSSVTNTTEGLFPLPEEIDLTCDCPDAVYMCKHIAAVLYGVGARLDHSPELLFLLRGVNHEDLITAEVAIDATAAGNKSTSRRAKVKGNLTDIFGINMDTSADDTPNKPAPKKQIKATNLKVPKKPQSITAASIKKLKKYLDLSNADFARLLGVSPSTISRWENQTGPLKLQDHNRERLLQVFDTA